MSLAVGRMDASLAEARAATDRASNISRGVAQSMFQLRDTVAVEIPLLGQPLVGLAPSFDQSGQNLELLGEDVVLAPEQTVVVDTDLDRAGGLARSFASRYLGLVNYCNSLRREGWEESDLAHGGSDRLLSEVVLIGDPGVVADGIRAHIDAGADNVNIQVLGDDPVAGYRSLAQELL